MKASQILESVETPAAVVDLARARDNAGRVAAYCADHGLSWRPHVKTHKSLKIAELQLEAGAEGVTVATPREAEVMTAASPDLLFAYPPVGEGKLSRLMALGTGVSLTVALDSETALEGLARAARGVGRTIGVLVEIDVGLGRVGVGTPGEAVALAASAHDLDGVEYEGIMFYPGHIRVPGEEQEGLLDELSELLERFYRALGEAGMGPSVVSGGSSPTLWQSHRLPGLTEIRPGTCIFMDRDMVGLGVCEWSQLAYSVLATVVSAAVPGQAVVDAGSKALAKEPTRARAEGYGTLLERPEVTVKALSEEHGVLELGDTSWRPRVGERVRIVPNHVCVSVNLQDRYVVLDGEVGELWPIEARGRLSP